MHTQTSHLKDTCTETLPSCNLFSSSQIVAWANLLKPHKTRFLLNTLDLCNWYAAKCCFSSRHLFFIQNVICLIQISLIHTNCRIRVYQGLKLHLCLIRWHLWLLLCNMRCCSLLSPCNHTIFAVPHYWCNTAAEDWYDHQGYWLFPVHPCRFTALKLDSRVRT